MKNDNTVDQLMFTAINVCLSANEGISPTINPLSLKVHMLLTFACLAKQRNQQIVIACKHLLIYSMCQVAVCDDAL